MKPIEVDYSYKLENYAIAPYNFVSLHKKTFDRYEKAEELPAHNSFSGRQGEKLYSGFIDYSLRAETPIIVSAGEDKKIASFFRNSDGKYAIPGNTIRGMVRSSAQILGFSSVRDDIQDSTFLYRDVAGDTSLNKKYNSVLGVNSVVRIALNVRAGIMRSDGKNFYIKPSNEIVEGRTYFRVDEIWLRKNIGNKILGIKYMYKDLLLTKEEELKKINKELADLKQHTDKERKRELENHKSRILNTCENKEYDPYTVEISFEYDSNKKRITKIGGIKEYKNEGYLLSGGFIRGKMSHYVVPSESSSNELKVDSAIITHYKDDLIQTKKMSKDNKLKKNNEFFGLPKKFDKKPVFFINANGQLHFGFTPYLRVSYSKSVHDGIPKDHGRSNGISYTDALFGFINKDISYKSRVSFADAVAIKEAIIDEESSITMLLGEPKATSYNMYLDQEGKANKKELAIYEDQFSIRGIKQYWLKKTIENPNVNEKDNKNMTFKIMPLKEGTYFSGRIYFNSLHEDELGLLLWAIKLNEGCYQNIGMAKPYGFGRVKIEGLELNIENLERKYNEFSFDYFDKGVENEYIKLYKNYIAQNFLGVKSADIDNIEPIKELMYIKSKVVQPEERKHYRYMNIKFKEYQKKNPLPKILEYGDIVSGKKAFHVGFENKQRGNFKGSNTNKNRYHGESKNNKSYNSYNDSANKGFNMPFADLSKFYDKNDKKK